MFTDYHGSDKGIYRKSQIRKGPFLRVVESLAFFLFIILFVFYYLICKMRDEYRFYER